MSTKLSWRQLIEKEGCLVLPGAYDALSARLIQDAGFSAYMIGGFPLVGSRYAMPDIGLVGLGEMAAWIREIISASTLPVLVDGDNGYGDVKSVAMTIRTYEKMGAAAILLEDQVAPKRCGHMSGKKVVSSKEMVKKLKAALAARENSDFFIIARTDARQVNGLDDALRRAEAYIKAGADGIFVEAPESVEELELIAKTFDVPQLCNMLVGGRTPILSKRELAEMGYAMIVHGISLIMRAAKVFQEFLVSLREDRLEPIEHFVSFEEFKRITRYDDWMTFEKSVS